MTAVLAWLSGSSWGRYLAAGLVGAIALVLILLAAFSRGQKSAQYREQAEAGQAVAKALKVNREVQDMPLDQRRAELRKWARG